MNRFQPCPNCHRHVYSTDARCPFCDEAVPATSDARSSSSLPTGRLSRIAVLAAGAALAGTAAASCADSPKNKADAGATGGQTATGGQSAAGGNGGGATSTGGIGVGTGGGVGKLDAGGGATDGGTGFDGPIAIYAAAIALPTNKT